MLHMQFTRDRNPTTLSGKMSFTSRVSTKDISTANLKWGRSDQCNDEGKDDWNKLVNYTEISYRYRQLLLNY